MRIKILLINSALLLVLFFALYHTYQLWRKYQEVRTAAPSSISLPQSKGVKNAIVRKTPQPHPVEQTAIELNLFSPERTEYVPPPPEKKEEEIKKVALPGKKISLYGIVVMNGYQKALIADPYSQTGQPPYRWVKAGDAIGDFKVKAIQDQGITVADADSVYQILLYNAENVRQRSSGDTPATAGKAPTVIQSSTDSAKRPETPKDDIKTDQQKDFEYIKTPFGLIRRKK